MILLAMAIPLVGGAQVQYKPMTANAISLMQKGDSCMQMNDTYNSMLCYEQACAMSFNDTIVRRLAQCYYKRGQYKKSLQLADTLLLSANEYQDLRLRFNCLQKISAPDSVVAECGRKIVAINQLDGVVVAELVSYFCTKKMLDSAMYYGNAYCRIDSTNQTVNRQLARACFLAHDYYRAIDLFLELYHNGDNSPTTLYFIGKSYENCAIFEKAYDFIFMSAEESMFAHVGILKSLASVSLRVADHRDEALEYSDMALNLCVADSASMAEIYLTKASFYEGYAHQYRDDTVKRMTCLRNQVRMASLSLKYNISLEAQYRMSLAYNAMGDLENERKWLQTIADYGWERNKSTSRIMSYVDWRMNNIEEEAFFKGE